MPDVLRVPAADWIDGQLDRTGSVGSSDMAAVLGLSPWCGPVGLWREKCSRVAREVPDSDGLLAWGTAAEAAIAANTAAQLGCSVEVVPPCRSSSRAHAHASLDRLIVSPGSHLPSGQGVLECKLSLYPWQELPRHYHVQVQHQLYVTGLDWAVVAATCCGRPPEFWLVERDETWLTEVMLPALDAFWRCVVDVVPPEPTDLDREPPTDPPTRGRISLPIGADLWVQEIFTREARIAAEQSEVDRLKNKLRLALVDANDGVLVSGGVVTYRPNTAGARVLRLPRSKR